MIRTIGLIAALALACGAAPELGDEQEFGTLEQDMSAPTTPNFQFGTRNASSNGRCDKVSTGQVCEVPKSKTMSWCSHMSSPSGFSTAQQNAIQAIINQFDGIQGWTFNSNNPSDPNATCNPSGDIQIFATLNACGQSGTSSNNIKDYACLVFFGETALTEGSGVVGSYLSHSGCIIKIDNTDIETKGQSATEDDNYFRHAFAHGLAGCLGIGGRDTTSAIASRQTMSATTAQTALSGCEQQSLLQLNTNVPGSFNNLQSCGPND